MFERNDEQQAILEMVRQFVDEQIIPKAERYDAADEFAAPIVEELARGWIRAACSMSEPELGSDVAAVFVPVRTDRDA